MSECLAEKSRRAVSLAPNGLVVSVYLVVFMALLDINIVVVALPAMRTVVPLTDAASRWVATSYPLCVSALALSAGSIGDRFGRKRVFLFGVALFTAGSGLCAAATSAGFLIGARFVQGAGAAIAVPATLSLIAHRFVDPARRARVMGGWASVTGVAGVIGPVAGGLLVDGFGWRAIFLINVPLGVAAVLIGARSIDESADPTGAGVDLAGQLLAITWLGAVSYGLIRAGQSGWTQRSTITALILAAVALALFLAVESRARAPMVTPRIFTDPRVAVPSFAACALGFSAMSLLFFLPAFLQRVQHHSPAATGLLLLPLPAATAAGAAIAGRWAAKAGPRAAMVTGFGLITAALFGLMAVAPDSGYLFIAALLLPLGLGGGLALTSTNLAALGAITRTLAGTASALLLAIRQTGNSLGIALLGTLLTTTATAATGACPAGAVCDHLAEAYTVGLHIVVATAGTVTLAAAILSAPVGPLVTRVIRACARHPAGAGE